MGVFDRIFKRSETVTTAEDKLLRALTGGDGITAEKAMEIPAFSAAVDFIAGTVAMLPVRLYEENPADRSTSEITEDRRLFLLNDETGGLMSAYDAKKAQVQDMLTYGNGYMYINRLRNDTESLHYVSSGDVSVRENSDPIFRTAQLHVGGRVYLPHEFVILTRNTKNGVRGRGAVEEHKTLIATMYNSLRLENAVTKTGGSKKGFLTSEKKLTEGTITAIRRAWEELYSNDNNNMIILENGMKFQESSATSVEMQLNQNKLTNSGMITQIFGLSPEVISGKASEAVYMAAIKTAVLPIVDSYQAALNKALLLESEKPHRYFVLDTSELLRGDMATRFSAYKTAIESNILQIDEVRYKEDLPPLGFNYIKLGLSDVLLDPKTKTIYTPNTNQSVKFGEKVLTGGEGSGIIEAEQRFNPYHDKLGRFTSKSGISLDKSAKSGIIKVGGVGEVQQAKTRDKKIYITEIAISKVNPPIISDLSPEQNEAFKQLHQDLLRTSMNENDSDEVAFLFSPVSMKCEKQFGTQSSVNVFENPFAFEMARNCNNNELYLMHNHPSTKTFSYSDIGVFLMNDSLGGISVVTNTGDVHILCKTKRYDFAQAYEMLSDIRAKFTSEVLDEINDAEVVKQFLKSSKACGIVSM